MKEELESLVRRTSHTTAGSEERGRDKNQGMRQCLEAGKGKEMYLPQNTQKKCSLANSLILSPVTPVLDFNDKTVNNKFVLFKLAKHVIICHSSNRK